MPTTRIFWDVDTQVDFLAPQGKLYVSGSESILPNLERLTRWAAHHDVLIVASACAHQPSDPEFQNWPPHCLVGTEGQRKIPATSLEQQFVIPNQRIELPAGLSSFQQIILEKQELDVFTNPNTAALVEQLGRPAVVLYGVVTELCVDLAARRLLQHGCNVTMVRDAVYALDQQKAQQCREDFAALGGNFASTSEIVA